MLSQFIHYLGGQRNIKPVLVFNESDIANRSSLFYNTLNQLVSLFTDEAALENSISLVVTQHQNADVPSLLQDVACD